MGGLFDLRQSSNERQVRKIAACGKCGLWQNCHSPRLARSGLGKRNILSVTDYPTPEDDKQGVYFQDEAGDFLSDSLKNLGFDLDDASITAAIICSPKGKLKSGHASFCQPNLNKILEKEKPSVIVTFGDIALSSVLDGVWEKNIGALSRWTGYQIPLAQRDAWLCPMEHPRDALLKRETPFGTSSFQLHLSKALRCLFVKQNALSFDDLKAEVEIVKDTEDAKTILKALAKEEGYLAFDYETTGLKPDADKQKIVSVSFCFNNRMTVAFKMNEDLKEPLSQVLKNPKLKKIASNLKFEERWTRAKLGHGVVGWYWDTMLAAHLIDNRPHITSIKFQAFVLLGVADYSSHMEEFLRPIGDSDYNRIEEMNEEDLLLYNGLDSLLEYKVMKKQKEIVRGKNDPL